MYRANQKNIHPGLTLRAAHEVVWIKTRCAEQPQGSHATRAILPSLTW